MKDLENGTTCMWVKQVVKLVTVRAKQFHAYDNNEMPMKIETVLVQASMHVNDIKRSQKSRNKTLTPAKTQKAT